MERFSLLTLFSLFFTLLWVYLEIILSLLMVFMTDIVYGETMVNYIYKQITKPTEIGEDKTVSLSELR